MNKHANNNYIDIHSQEDFYRARNRAFIQSITRFLQPRKYELLSLDEVKKILRPGKEAYQGIKAVAIDLIVGSEGRYNDFNKEFLPRYDHLKPRWLNIDKLYLKDVVWPPIQLYEIGGVYFVRDGNHRVSVARSQGMDMIDAEIVHLDSIVPITRDMGKNELRKKVIGYEKKRFEEKTQFSSVCQGYSLEFTSTGRYNEVLFHILEHKYYINEDYEQELQLGLAVLSWFNKVYMPITRIVREHNLLLHFPDRTEGDMYVWISKHWQKLKEKYGESVEIQQAANEIAQKKSIKLFTLIGHYFRKIFRKNTHPEDQN